MGKLTKGQKNELRRLEYQRRVDAIEKHGYTILEQKDFYDRSYYVIKNGTCVHPGEAYEDHGDALGYAESLIKSA